MEVKDLKKKIIKHKSYKNKQRNYSTHSYHHNESKHISSKGSVHNRKRSSSNDFGYGLKSIKLTIPDTHLQVEESPAEM